MSETARAEAHSATARRHSELATSALVFSVVLGAHLGAMWLTTIVLSDVDALASDPASARSARFCGFLALVTAYMAVSLGVARRGARRDFAALRTVTEATHEEWQRFESRFRDRRGPRVAAAIGFAVGLAVNGIGVRVAPFGKTEIPWVGFLIWSALLNGLLFACLGMLVRWSLLEIRALRAIGRRARVSLLDRTALAPFVRTGLRGSLLWLGGTSLATTLLLDVNAPWLVLAVLSVTTGLAIAALLLPSRGLHERLRAVKQAELAWVRREIERVRDALPHADAASRDTASRLPALLAWEARVEQSGEWPFDTPTLLRFALLLLVPIGSWLGGALVERVVDAFFSG